MELEVSPRPMQPVTLGVQALPAPASCRVWAYGTEQPYAAPVLCYCEHSWGLQAYHEPAKRAPSTGHPSRRGAMPCSHSLLAMDTFEGFTHFACEPGSHVCKPAIVAGEQYCPGLLYSANSLILWAELPKLGDAMRLAGSNPDLSGPPLSKPLSPNSMPVPLGIILNGSSLMIGD